MMRTAIFSWTDLQKPLLWTLLYVDDVMLASEDKDVLERELQACLVQVALVDWRALRYEDTERLKSKIYRAVIRPVAMYGTECWPAAKEVETRLSVKETKMLRWTAGVTLKGRSETMPFGSVRCRAADKTRNSLATVRPRSAKEEQRP
ncbi:unnamed protein product [Heligmosomoides polygyrus]|uniref:Reverse transcriptase domain-containing protein n=1 Tax=Heligmosomoides polygyrus TaxID=6339 RepID=A0A183GAN6_HELPZ|nr:unnamed protein product [Heligmosomoides polygyrus]